MYETVRVDADISFDDVYDDDVIADVKTKLTKLSVDELLQYMGMMMMMMMMMTLKVISERT